MGQEDSNDQGLDEEVIPFNLTSDEIAMLAYALEYECNDGIQGLLNDVLEKIEHGLHVDTYVGNRLAEHGRIMGWSKES